jgi:GH25 family lysozyme M1 (1,4-beta-N-acetylmuramidase)
MIFTDSGITYAASTVSESLETVETVPEMEKAETTDETHQETDQNVDQNIDQDSDMDQDRDLEEKEQDPETPDVETAQPEEDSALDEVTEEIIQDEDASDETGDETSIDENTESVISSVSLEDEEEPEDGDDDPQRGRAEGDIDSGFFDEADEYGISMASLDDGYTHDSRFKGYTVKTGIDVSSHNGTINWKKVKADGVEFAFIRVGYRGYGESGSLNEDANFEQNIKGALAAGLQVGVYFFSQAINTDEAEAEAKYLLNLISGYKITLPVVMDFEYASVSGAQTGRLYKADLSKNAATRICRAFCKKVTAKGYEAMVYANKDMLTNHLNASDISDDYKIWLANYTSQTTYSGEYDYWQYSSSGSVSGISGNVDLDFWYVAPKASEVTATQPADSVSVPDGLYTLNSVLDEQLVVDIKDASTANLANAELHTSADTDTQKFYIHSIGNKTYILISAASGKVLEVQGSGVANSVNVCQNAYTGLASQKWWFTMDANGYYTLTSAKSGKVLDVKNGNAADGANVQQYASNGSDAQKFSLTSCAKKTIEEGNYVFFSALAGDKVLDISGASQNNGGNVQLYQINGSAAQQYTVSYNGDGTYTIKAAHSGKVLDVSGGGYANGTNVQQYVSNGSAAQKWMIRKLDNGNCVFISAASGKVLDIKGGSSANSTNVQIYEYNGSNAQKWNLIKKASASEGVYTIHSALADDVVVDISGGSMSNKANAQIYTANGSDAQKFYLRNVGNNTYILISFASGKVLEVADSSRNNGGNVRQNAYSGSNNQKWWLLDNGDGSYSLMSTYSGKVLDVKGGSSSNGTNLQQYTWDKNNAQKFTLTESNAQTAVEGTYMIRTALTTDKTIDISGGSQNNGANAQIYQMNNSSAQYFKVKYNGDGTYTFFSEKSGKVLDVSGGSYANGANVQQYASNGSAAQKWLIRNMGNGTYMFFSAASGKALDVKGASTNNSTNVQVYEGNGSNAQKWSFLSKPVSITEGVYSIQSGISDAFAVDISGASISNKANAQIYSYNGSDAQRFYFRNVGSDMYILISAASGKVLEVADSNKNNYANVRQNAYTGSSFQKWWLFLDEDGRYTLMSVGSGKVLDVSGGKAQNGTNVQQYASNGSNAQKFILTESNKETIAEDTYMLCSGISTTKVLDISGASQNNSANVQLWQMNGTTAQRFKFSYNGDGTYTITAVHSGKVLDVNGGGYANGTNVQQYTSNGSAAQKWLIRSLGDGYYAIFSAASGKALDAKGGKSTNGTNIQIYEYNGSNAQKFLASTKGYVETYPGLASSEQLKISAVTGEKRSDTQMTVTITAKENSKVESLSSDFCIVLLDTDGVTALEGKQGTISLDNATFTISAAFDSTDQFRTLMMNKFAIAIPSGAKYQIVSDSFYLSNPEITASTTYAYRGYYEGNLSSIKGMQGTHKDDTVALGINTALINIKLNELVKSSTNVAKYGASTYVPYVYKGKTYYFHNMISYMKTVKDLNGWYGTDGQYGEVHRQVSVNLLLGWDKDLTYLIHPSARQSGHTYYTLNTVDQTARDTYEALFCYMAEKLGGSVLLSTESSTYKYRVCNWILGNEVNASKAWNYSGNMSLQTYVSAYADAFQLLYQGVKRTDSEARVFVSLDHDWTKGENGFGGKAFLDQFAAYMYSTAPHMRWNVNYHPYAQPLTNNYFMNDSSNTTASTGTPFISMKNFQVLTDYLSALENKYFAGKGSGYIRVIIGEIGYSSASSGGEASQSEAIQTSYNIAKGNSRVDAFLLRAYNDDPAEGVLKLGLRDRYENKKTAYDMYKNLN